MTAARWRRTALAPLAALAIACLALAAWTATALAAPVDGAPGDATVVGTPPASDPGTTSGQSVDPQPDSGTVTQDPAPQPDPPAADPGTPPQQPDPPATEQPAPPVSGDSPDARTGDHWTDTSSAGSGSHSDSAQSPSPGPSTTTQSGTSVQMLPPMTPDGAFAVPLTQFPVLTGSSSGGSGATAALLAGSAHIGCIAGCPGGSRLVGTFRLALSHDARTAVRVARARADGTAAKASAPSLLGLGGAAGVGLFNLLIGGGGSAGAVVFVAFLAVLMALIALPRDWTMGFRSPAAAWRPSAYVTPIELPG